MKALLITFVLVALAVYLVFQFGLSGFDPAAEAAEVKPKIEQAAEAGQSWAQLIAIKEPGRFQGIRPPSEFGNDRTAEVKFERAAFEDAFNSGSYDLGFVLIWQLAGDKVEVIFDDQGNAVEHYTIKPMDPMNPLGN